MTKRLVVGLSGASGIGLGVMLLRELRRLNGWETHLVCSAAARQTLACETELSYEELTTLAHVAHEPGEVGAAIASGSFRTEGMVVVPCSMKTLAGIAHGYADNLLIRAADVVLKERRRLVLVTRETPLHLGHLRNMTTAAELGAVIMPPMMTHYIRPTSVEDMERHLVGRVLGLFGVELPGCAVWQGMAAGARPELISPAPIGLADRAERAERADRADRVPPAPQKRRTVLEDDEDNRWTSAN